MISLRLIQCGFFGHQWGKAFVTTSVYPGTDQVCLVRRSVCERCNHVAQQRDFGRVEDWLNRPANQP